MIDLSKKTQLRRALNAVGKTKRQQFRDVLKQCLTIWSQIIRKRDKHTCQWCGSKTKPQAHHIVAQSLCSTIARLDQRNGVTLCYACHIHRLKIDQDGYIKWRDEWMRYRALSYGYLRNIFGARGKTTLEELVLVKAQLEQQLEGMKCQ